MNSPTPTKVYEQLTKQYGEQVSESDTNSFIEQYISIEGLKPDELIPKLQNNWNTIADEYHKRAEKVWNYLTSRRDRLCNYQ